MTCVIAATLAVICLAAPAQQLPANILVPDVYRPAVAAMLRYSPTFRTQCNRLARRPDLQIVITTSLLPGMDRDEAVTRIVRRPNGAMEADVQLGALGDPVLLLAHEFEHILEQLDGVDLVSMASRSATGVHQVPGSEHYETDRAIAIGRRVADEVTRGRSRSGM
jgi:hypothetical protein